MSSSQKISQFSALTSLNDSDLVTVVSGGQNFTITWGNLKSGLGVTGSLETTGAALGTPLLNSPSANEYEIRNLESGSGVKVSVSAENGALLAHNFTQDPGGIDIFRNRTAIQPTFLSLAEGDGIDLSLDGDKLTIAASATVALTKIVTVNDISEFPAPVAGVITLEDNTGYQIANNISTSNRFALGNNCALLGFSSVITQLTYTGSGTMFTGSNVVVDMRGMLVNCTNGKVFDISGSASRLIIDTMTVISCNAIGTLNNCFTSSIENLLVLSANQGIDVIGTGWTLISFNRLALISTQASFIGIDMGSSISPTYEITDLSVNAPAGATGISGLPNSGNIPAGSLGTIARCNFDGGVTAEGGGLDAANAVRWETTANDDIADTMPDGLVSLSGNATETVIAASSTDGSNAVKVDGTWVCNRESIFECDTTGRVTSKAERSLVVPVTASFSLLAASGGDAQASAYLAVNDTVITETKVQVTMNSSKAGAGTLVWQYDFQEDDYVEVWVENNDNAINIIANGVLRVN